MSKSWQMYFWCDECQAYTVDDGEGKCFVCFTMRES